MSIEVMKRLVAAVEAIPEEVEGWMPDALTDALIDARQAIAEAEKQEPACCSGKCPNKKECENAMQCLYTHPQPKREPLTNENPLLVFAKECVLGAYREDELADAAQRAIKAAHGTKEKNT